jgi:N-acetyl-D-muramate 6-phosphate phosphatase
MQHGTIDAVLFDLDGTLADTARDLAGALNRLREEEGLPPVPFAQLRPVASNGVRGLLGVGFDMAVEHPRYGAFAERFLDHYMAHLCVETVLFDGIAALIDELQNRRIAWGVVTNKKHRFTMPLVADLGLASRAGCIVSGDTAARPKPHPDPLLFAADLLSVAPSRCLYVGDDVRDIQAGAAAGMGTVAAAYGYLGCAEPIQAWGADHLIGHPGELLPILDAALG